MKNTKNYNFSKLTKSGPKMICIRVSSELHKICKQKKIKPSHVARQAIATRVMRELSL